mmetsp:Transcript_21716/g.88553  ORF Transcript_21716/g.88553 Transcript_21716/m.88553 type:complete len:838 (-) Transcript_21716:507-3020(-)|eukprot:CAMPEP_0113960286 /NCGR_PEP_ID=MMETSP0011_2-20120614/4627_1 /TAXON_ID=101924 /ORGANISM="Rhodosorus marinus" /LENGTH=837 /DNA_ID=CAMNT_0000971715 /DNA_START=203 /DNA_END=2716 /DNA_ORIENTATION=+ /assembly_acc=CAM_ASM_000156
MDARPLVDKTNAQFESKLRVPGVSTKGPPRSSPKVGDGTRIRNGQSQARQVAPQRRRAGESRTARPKVPRTAVTNEIQHVPGELLITKEEFQQQMEDLSKRVEDKEKQLKDEIERHQKESLANSHQVINALQTSSTTLMEQTSSLAAEAHILRTEKDKVVEQLNSEQRRVLELTNQVEREQQSTAELKSTLELAQRRANEAEALVDIAEQARSKLQSELEQASAVKNLDLEKQLELSKEKETIQDKEIARLRAEIDEGLDRFNDCSEKLKSMHNDLDRAKARNSSVESELRTAQFRCEGIEREKISLEYELEKSRKEHERQLASVRDALDRSEKERKSCEEEVNRNRSTTKIQEDTIAQLELVLESSRRDGLESNEELKRVIDKFERAKKTERQLEDDLSRLRDELQSSEKAADECARRIREQESTADNLSQRILDLENAIQTGKDEYTQLDTEHNELKLKSADQEQQIQDYKQLSKKLKNEVQELKGNIRVFCRLRPGLNEHEASSDIYKVNTRDGILTAANPAVAPGKGDPWKFKFDHVFHALSTQEQVFDEVSQVVESSLDGYSVCLFAYGQTGSGKTYTMLGNGSAAVEEHGVIPRAIRLVFDRANELQEDGWTYTLKASFLEIYNDDIWDLLPKDGDQRTPLNMRTTRGSQSRHVHGLNELEATSPEQVNMLIKKSMAKRATAATKMNEKSSRSHSVFRIHISGHRQASNQTVQSALNLIDLAGSERLKSSGSEGERLKETQHINKSLTALGDVIMALSNRRSHIPYRNSKLTEVLEDSLGGNCKTLMFVNVSPSEASFSESMQSLRFASKVNSVEIGTARKQQKIDMGPST